MHVRRWKDLLPDGATWFEGGFPKARLQSHDEAYLRRFAAEARRGELAHAVMLCFIPLFFTYNPPWASAVMTVVGLVLNVPCLLTQRYNRHRLRSLLRNRRRHTDL